MFSVSQYTNAQTSIKGHKHNSSSTHGNRRNSSKHAKPTRAKSSKTGPPPTVLCSFLFIVNELQVDFEPLPGVERPLTDQWFNTLPPQRAEAYTGETVGAVFRYHNGETSPAPEYAWHRPAMGHGGAIVRINQAGMIDGWPAPYKTQTIFACSPLLPVIVTDGDASLGYSVPRQLCLCDARYNEDYTPWHQLHFERREGVSYVNSNGSGETFVAGRNASWIPSLVPSVYQNTADAAEPSRGLSGDLPIILALMAFHGRLGRANSVFRDRKWRQSRWHGSEEASPYLPKAGESPRGFVVQVCADNLVHGQADSEENNIPEDECRAILGYLEYSTILVRDP